LPAIRCSFREYADVLTPALAGSAGMVCVVLALRVWVLPGMSPPVSLTIQVLSGGATYGAILFGGFRDCVLRYIRFLARYKAGDLGGQTADSPVSLPRELA